MGSHGEAEAREHPRRIALHRGVDEFLEAREIHDAVELTPDLLAGHAEDGPVEEDVLPASQVGMKPRADLNQSGEAPVHGHPAEGWLHDPGQQLQDRALACAIAPDDRERFAAVDFKGDVL